jgi:hypothetical protein
MDSCTSRIEEAADSNNTGDEDDPEFPPAGDPEPEPEEDQKPAAKKTGKTHNSTEEPSTDAEEPSRVEEEAAESTTGGDPDDPEVLPACDPEPEPEEDHKPAAKKTSGSKRKATQKGKKAPKRAAKMPREKKATTPRPPQTSYKETGRKLIIPEWNTVQPLLEKSGYAFRRKLYCRPLGDPVKYPKAQEDVDYFTSQESFRAYLCANGVEYVGAPPWIIGDEDKKDIGEEAILRTWVRYSILKSHPDADPLPELELKLGKAMKLLTQKLGFQYTHTSLGDGYLLPGTTKKDGGTVYKDKELWEHLAKNGLPESCYECEAITDRMELLALEQVLAQQIDLDDYL